MLNFNISEFFKRISSIQGKEAAVRQAIQSACKEVGGVEVDIKDITIKSGIVSIKNLSSSARSALFIKKTGLIERINSIQTIRAITDVR